MPDPTTTHAVTHAHRAADVSAVVCAYTEERWDDLQAALTSLRTQTTPPGEVVVVVDHNDALLDRVRHAAPDVVAVANAERQGLSGARNTGVAAARGALLAFLDDDAVAEPDWLEHLVAAYRDPAVIAVGGFRHGIGRVGTRPVGCEETEFCIRARSRFPAGLVLFEPTARVRHRVTRSRARWSYFRSRCYAEGLSKALVTRVAGTGPGLASERRYTLRTLPAGAARGIGDALRGDLAGLARTAAIVAGLGLTAAGYLLGTAAGRLRATAREAS
jgi:hypothetical protein